MNTAGPSADVPTGTRGPLLYIGAAGLATAAAVDCVAVAGRWLSLPLHGALEIIQAAVLVTACASMLAATLADSHASVHLLTNRASPGLKVLLRRFAAITSTLLFIGLTVASIWLAREHWSGHEESELLHIPYRPLRIVSCLSMLAIMGVYAYRTVRPRETAR